MSSTEPASIPETAGAGVAGEPLASGTEFGSYRIVGAIGAGAMGTVYRAEHRWLGKQVALKLMSPALRTSEEARQRFFLEAKTTASIRHRHVLEIIDFSECGAHPYIVMDLLDGEDLERYLDARGRLSAREAVSLLLPIVAALAAVHDAGVVHRDLKPSNIFLHREPDGSMVPKLLDFGIAKQTLGLSPGEFQGTSWNQLLGSPQYLPPEAIHGSRDLTTRSDQYSLGVVLYEAVTGRTPIERQTLLELLNAIARAEFVPPSQGLPELPGPMERAILRCMQQDPAARFGHVRELGRALLELADERTQLLWTHEFNPASEVLSSEAPSASAPLVRVSRDAPTRSPPARAKGSSRQQLLSLGAVSLVVLVVCCAALLAVAPSASVVERSVRPHHDVTRSAAPPQVPASPGASTLERRPQESSMLDVASTPDQTGATSAVAALAVSTDVRPTSHSKPAARAKRRSRSPRSARWTGTVPIPPAPQEAGAELGANESPFFD